MAYKSLLDRLGLYRPGQRAWALYDVANSSWMTTVVQFFQIYIVAVGVAGGLNETEARARYAFASAIAIIVIGLTGPLLGAIADYRGSKKAFLAAFLAVGASSTAAMYFTGEGQWVFALTTFIVGKVCVTATLAFYNALLPAVAEPDEVDRVSTAGFALGYLGGGTLFLVNALMVANPERFGIANADLATRLSFVSVAVWWVVFSIPLFRKVPEPPPRLEADEHAGENPVVVASRRLVETFRELRTYKDAGLVLLAFLVYNDGVNTIVHMAVTFGGDIGIADSAMIGALVMVQFVGIPFAFAFGLLADRIGTKNAIYITLAVYTGISFFGFVLQTETQFYVLAFIVGTVQGAAQALGRSLFASLIPRHKAGEMFGFFGVFDRFGGVFGSLIFGLALTLTGSSRPAIILLIIFFALGAFLLSKVDVERGRRLAQEAEAAVHAPETDGSA
jgi:UMF1 family MFS transporter